MDIKYQFHTCIHAGGESSSETAYGAHVCYRHHYAISRLSGCKRRCHCLRTGTCIHMCVCMCVCVYIYTYVCVCLCMYVCAHVCYRHHYAISRLSGCKRRCHCLRTGTCIHMCVCMCVCVYIYIYIYIYRICMYMYIYIYIFIHVCAYVSYM